MNRENVEPTKLDQRVREALKASHLKKPDWQVVGLLTVGTAMAAVQTGVLLSRQDYAWHTWAMIVATVILFALTIAFACMPKLRRVSLRAKQSHRD